MVLAVVASSFSSRTPSPMDPSITAPPFVANRCGCQHAMKKKKKKGGK